MILDEYIMKLPSNQNKLDIFKGEWSSILPSKYGLATGGNVRLFEDERIDWAKSVLGHPDFSTVLELGPLEGGHSYMLQGTTNEVTAIEANTRAYLKCLIIKEILELDVDFQLGDFNQYLKTCNSKFDVVYACGVLYHQKNPMELIKLISKVTDKVFIWTHYFDADVILNRHDISYKFSSVDTMNYDGEQYEYSEYAYSTALEWNGFCGGPSETSIWLTRNSLINTLKKYGFINMEFSFDDTNHPNGSAVAICAWK